MYPDLRSPLRQLLRAPRVVVPVLVSMALAIGASVAVFSVIYGVSLRPLPFPGHERLVMLWESQEGATEGGPFFATPVSLQGWQEQSRSFTGIAAVEPGNYSLSGVGEAERYSGAAVSANVFGVLGATPVLGRGFLPQEDAPGGERVVVLSHGLWQRRFGGDPGVLGRAVTLNGAPHTVVGVLPRDLRFPREAELWVPLALSGHDTERRTKHYLMAVARLKPGVSVERAEAEMAAVAASLARTNPASNGGWRVDVVTLREQFVGDLRPSLSLLALAVALVLLIACVNAANLLLSRAIERSREMAVRSALGATRGRLARQLLGEGVVLALASGVLGVALARIGLPLLVALSPVELPAFREIGVDGTVLAFTLAVTLACGVVFGVVPAVRGTSGNLVSPLKEDGGTQASTGRKGRHLQGALVVSEVALAVVLVINATLAVQAFERLQQVDFGFRSDDRLIFDVSLSEGMYPEEHQRNQFVQRALESLGEIPGVSRAAASSYLPLGENPTASAFSVEGRSPASEQDVTRAILHRVSPGFLEAMGIPLLEGRTLSAADHADAPGVAVVSEAFARQYWPGTSPIGKRVKRGAYDSDKPWLTVVGVVGNVRDSELASEVGPAWYLPYTQHKFTDMTFVLETRGDPTEVLSPVRRAIAAIDPALPVYNASTLRERVASFSARERFTSVAMGILALIGVVLGAVGVYSVVAYSIARRTQEIGIRSAVGARQGQIVGLVLGWTLRLTLAGLIVGVIGAMAVNRLLESVMVGLGRVNLASVVATSAIFLLVSLAAGLVPALRASRVDPIVALRPGVRSVRPARTPAGRDVHLSRR
ncbi:MAG TPA: ABC transporter permease [Longimicrobiaceae bacterium]|nr:ABC transporter permease [Longimicrobiaceae bacterium]